MQKGKQRKKTWGIEGAYNPAYGTLSSILAVEKC